MINLELKQKRFPVSCQCGSYEFIVRGTDKYQCKKCNKTFKIEGVEVDRNNLYKSYEVIKNESE